MEVRPVGALTIVLAISLVAAGCADDDDQAGSDPTATEAVSSSTTSSPSSSTTSTSTATTIPLPVAVEVTRDVPYTSERAVDVYAPAEGSGWPVVVHFHGGQTSPQQNEPLARAIAEQGVVVFVPSWRSLGPDGGSQDTICALAFAAEQAEEFGGDVTRVVPSGYSTGGFTALTHAFIGDDPPLPVTDCEVAPAIDLPDAVVGGGAPVFAAQWARDGFFDANPQWGSLTPEQIDAFDPHLAIGRNPNLRVRLVVGEEDVGGRPNVMFPIVESNGEYHAALVAAGYDVELTEVPGGHLEPITPGTESWTTYVDTIAATARGD